MEGMFLPYDKHILAHTSDGATDMGRTSCHTLQLVSVVDCYVVSLFSRKLTVFFCLQALTLNYGVRKRAMRDIAIEQHFRAHSKSLRRRLRSLTRCRSSGRL